MNKKDPNRPFKAQTLQEARKIVEQYDIVLRFEFGEWYGHALEYPEAMGDGKTIEEAVSAARESLVSGVATMIENGQSPPVPARSGQRTEQVNIKLTPEEKALLEKQSRARGFRGLSDFVRAGALEMANK